MFVRTGGLCALIIGVLGSAAVIAGPADAYTQQAPVVHSVRVYIGDLRAHNTTDAAVLYQRIRVAAEAACGERQLPESHFIDPAYRSCVDLATKDAVAQVDSAVLSAYYQRHRSRDRRG